MDLTQVLDLARNWQKNATEIHGTMMTATREWVIDFGGHLMVQGNGIVVTRENGYEFRIVLDIGMTFNYADWMLQIDAPGWHCNLYEDRYKPFVRLV
jgi:hypothetical protein